MAKYVRDVNFRYEFLDFVHVHSHSHSALVGYKKSMDLHDMQFVALIIILCFSSMPIHSVTKLPFCVKFN